MIKAPLHQIYSRLIDFNHWTAWSPWLIQEPEAEVTVSNDAKAYAWEGQRVGSGRMRIIQETPESSIDYDLIFLKPWKSEAKIRFELLEQGGQTRVMWVMESQLPFYLFWMKKSMTTFVGMDFQRGLLLLKDYMEDGEVHCLMNIEGERIFPGCHYVGITNHCTMETVRERMKQDFSDLHTLLNSHKSLLEGNPLCIYHKCDLAHDMVTYTAAVPITEWPQNLPDHLVQGQIPITRVYTLTHRGSYKHLSNAWSTLISLQRAKAFKANKRLDPFETYPNTPDQVPDQELLTMIHFPAK